MTFLDFFRPEWRHSQPDRRKEAISQLTDEAILNRVISDDLSPELQNLARERMLQLHHDGLQSPDLAVRIATIPKLRTDPPDLKVPWLLEAIVDEY